MPVLHMDLLDTRSSICRGWALDVLLGISNNITRFLNQSLYLLLLLFMSRRKYDTILSVSDDPPKLFT